MEFHKLRVPLNSSQYYKAKYKKKFIFLHHTVGASAQSSVEWWNSKPDHVATPYIIDRDGKCYEVFNPDYWSYALGLKGGTEIEKQSIQIELTAWGRLTEKNGKFYFGTRVIPPEEVVVFKNFYRESYYYHKYTDAQLATLANLIKYLCIRFDITLQCPLTNFWFYDPNWVKNQPEGLWSHSTVRKDKSDIMPQKELVEMVYGLTIP